jgi:hypothetical protein
MAELKLIYEFFSTKFPQRVPQKKTHRLLQNFLTSVSENHPEFFPQILTSPKSSFTNFLRALHRALCE